MLFCLTGGAVIVSAVAFMVASFSCSRRDRHSLAFVIFFPFVFGSLVFLVWSACCWRWLTTYFGGYASQGSALWCTSPCVCYRD